MMRSITVSYVLILSFCATLQAEKTQLGATIDDADRSVQAAAHRESDKLIRAKDFAAAEQELRKAIKLAPDYAPARYDLASLLIRLGRIEEGLAHLQFVAVKQRPQDLEARSRYARALKFTNQRKLAIDQLTEALRLDPAQIQLRRDLIGLLLDDRSFMQASNISAEGVKVRPQDASAHNDHGVVLMQIGKFGAAVDSFRNAIELDSEHIDANYNMGLVFFEQWNLEGAETYFRKALVLQPQYTDAHYNLGRTLARSGRDEEARAEFQETIRLKQDYFTAHFQLGMIAMRQTNYKKALNSFTEALRQNPGHQASKYQLGLAMAQLGRWELAARQFSSLLQTDKEHADAHFQLALALAATGKNQEAKAHFQEAKWLRPDWAQPRIELARLLADDDDEPVPSAASAVELAAQAGQQLDALYLRYLDTAAAAERAAGNSEEAGSLQEQAIDWAEKHALPEADKAEAP